MEFSWTLGAEEGGNLLIFFRLFKSIFLLLNFIVLFPSLIKYYNIMFIIIIVFLLGSDRPSGLLFVLALLLSILTTPLLPTSSVPLSYFILAVSIRKCLGKHSFMGSPFPIAILYGTCFFPTVQL